MSASLPPPLSAFQMLKTGETGLSDLMKGAVQNENLRGSSDKHKYAL